MVQLRCFGHVLDDAAFDYDAVFKALAGEPREVDGRVDADGCEGCRGVDALSQLGFIQDSEMGHDVLEPGVRLEELGEPFSRCGVDVFGSVVDHSILKVYTGIWYIFSEPGELWPCIALELSFLCAYFPYLRV